MRQQRAARKFTPRVRRAGWRQKGCRSALLTRGSRGNCRTEVSKPVAVTASSTVPEAGQLSVTEIAITLADSKNWIGDRRRSLASTTHVSRLP